jgi:NAD(P)-dependent dehydrogenase (short-subunit alcohol dehydrogenase family)
VTGAGGGIGRACVEQLVRDGCIHLLITDLVEETLLETSQKAKSINPEAEVIAEVADITKEASVKRLFKLAIDKFGRVDYALNVAGSFHLVVLLQHWSKLYCIGVLGKQAPIADIDLDGYDFVERVNARAVWLCERAAITQMLNQEPLPTQ